jgi:hypothetical protein
VKDAATITSNATFSGPGSAQIPLSQDGVYTVSYQTVDTTGKSDTQQSTSPIKVDLTPPTNIVIEWEPGDNVINNGDTFDVSPPTPIICTATDATSGMKNCTVTGFDPSVGSHIMSATATDNAGNTSLPTSVGYSVLFRWPGFSQPINDPAAGATTMSEFKAGSTVPVKFQLFDANNAPTQAQTTPLFSVNKVNIGCSSASSLESTSTDTADTTNTFRYDSTSQQYIHNWKTPSGPSALGCYQIDATFSHNVTRSVTVLLR